MKEILRFSLDVSRDKFFEEINEDVLAAELLQEGGVAEYPFVLAELVHGNHLQGIGVVSVCGE